MPKEVEQRIRAIRGLGLELLVLAAALRSAANAKEIESAGEHMSNLIIQVGELLDKDFTQAERGYENDFRSIENYFEVRTRGENAVQEMILQRQISEMPPDKWVPGPDGVALRKEG